MASNKLKHTIKEKLGFNLRFPKYAGYIDYFLQTPVSVQITNGYSENVSLSVTVSDADGLLVPYGEQTEIPFESAVELNAEGVFSPLYLSENNSLKAVTVEVSALWEGKELCRAQTEITVLPYDWWEGISGNAERLSAFVRPRLNDCARVLEDAGKRLKKWNTYAEFYGYAGADKSAVHNVVAAVYASMKHFGFEKTAETDLSAPLSAAASGSLIISRRANALELAVFTASCFEAAGLHPVLAVGKGAVAVGAWLYDSCFLDSVTDDCEIVGKYISDGINNLSFFDVEDLFSSKSVGFTASCSHFAQKLKEGFYEYFVDVRRCRIGNITALPLRGRGLKGYELVKERDMSDESAPQPLPEHRNLGLDGKQTKNKLWERRLLDLTSKNALLSFTGKNALHLYSADPDALYTQLTETGSMKLKAGAEGEPFGVEQTTAQNELILLEQRKGILRAFAGAGQINETAVKLLRRNREADEETGAKILYLAFGFLQYVGKEDGKTRYAPLILAPVDIRRARGNEDYSVENTEGEYFVNTTLLEYLKQEFNVDMRGLGDDISKQTISVLLQMVLAELKDMKGWTVTNDVYLAAFSFQRYLMWNDIRNHFDELKKNAAVSALLTGRAVSGEHPAVREEDEGDPVGTLVPLPADSSQYSAIALSRTGASFVLHGPPGTGKSQTITNIIANALEDGKRVLFVAEKKAALDVVKKRLDAIGIGDFCLELHSNKTDKADVAKRMEATLSLASQREERNFSERAEEIVTLREELKAPMLALHKKRRLGISVYQALLLYSQNKDAPDVLDIESSFYDSLTEKRLAECKNMILSAAAAAKECGGVFNSPFENVNVTEYSQDLRDRVFCACEVVVTEIKHLKAYLALFLEFYRQKISTITKKKLDTLCELARNLSSGLYRKYFADVTEEQFYVFYNANLRLDERLSYYHKHFRTLIELGKDREEIRRLLEAGSEPRGNKAALKAIKQLSRTALHPLAEEDLPKYLQTVIEIEDASARITSVPALASCFTDRGGDIVFKKRTEYLADLKHLHEMCAKVFMDFNADAFNGMCIRAQNGYTQPVLEGYLKAAEAYTCAQESFIAVTNADRKKIAQEDVLDYFSSRAGALIDNVDMLPNWCMYKQTAERLKKRGCSFIAEALENGRLTGETVLAGFEKNVYKNFLDLNIPADPELSRMTAGTTEETVEKFRNAWDEFSRETREKIRADLISRLPAPEGEGAIALEVAAFTRLAKANLRGTGIRGLFAEIPALTARISPCMLMSPTTVAQYLQPEADLFDLVIFDEASQMTTAEAVGAIARAKAAIVVGDPRQLPPTAFFRSAYVDEENLENEDLESVLDDCLALGMPERHLLWHYRSKHESLIAFSNSMYYENRLCTFPSPDSLESKVKFIAVDGTYDRGLTKHNRKEAEALVAEVIRRLSDPILSRSSMGVVTFSGAQQNYIERLLAKEIPAHKLEGVAYEREEPLFVKNLENVQGDERDVILFSVCYGPDGTGRVSLNFGPLNQAGGWRRLNVAVSRAREEMLVFSTMTAGMIDLAKTSSKGVAGLKAFLEFAEHGRTNLALKSASVKGGAGIGKYIANELSGYGYECRCDVGASDFKIDVAVIDPRNKHSFLLAVICDGTEKFSVKDRNVLQIQTLKRGNWNVMRVNCVNYYNNPKREVKRIKDMLDKLTGAERKGGAWLTKESKSYRFVKETGGEVAAFITSGENDALIRARLKEIVSVEEPISRAFLKARCLATFGITKSGSRVESRLDALIDGCAFRRERVLGKDYYYKNNKAVEIGKFRTETEPALRKTENDFTPFEIVAFIRSALKERVSMYLDELLALMRGVFLLRPNEKFNAFVRDCITYGEEKGILVRSVSDRISLA